eukprot:6284610-Amphidinium_carterae.1
MSRFLGVNFDRCTHKTQCELREHKKQHRFANPYPYQKFKFACLFWNTIRPSSKIRLHTMRSRSIEPIQAEHSVAKDFIKYVVELAWEMFVLHWQKKPSNNGSKVQNY